MPTALGIMFILLPAAVVAYNIKDLHRCLVFNSVLRKNSKYRMCWHLYDLSLCYISHSLLQWFLSYCHWMKILQLPFCCLTYSPFPPQKKSHGSSIPWHNVQTRFNWNPSSSSDMEACGRMDTTSSMCIHFIYKNPVATEIWPWGHTEFCTNVLSPMSVFQNHKAPT